MEYGLISLFAVELILAFLVFQAYRSISTEGHKLSSLLGSASSQQYALDVRITAATDAANEARRTAQALRETHYDAVMARLSQLEATTEKLARTIENTEEKIKSVNARASAIARHRRKLEEEEDGAAEQQAVEFEQPAAAPVSIIPRHFGRRIA